MLSAIAVSMITVAGVVFSITIVALAQASTQYSPRVLRNFMRDRSNQVVLGAFVGIFAYCLVVLRNITWKNSQEFVPTLAILIAFILALIGIGFLIYFIHHIASSIQASVMIHAITAETLAVIHKMFPEKLPQDRDQEKRDNCLAEESLETWYPVPARTFGYIQRVERDELLDTACQHKLVLRMEVGVGEFAHQNRPLMSVCGCGQPDEKLIRQINASYGIDAHRTVDQDPGFGVQQLVDIAVKALSPGINDTTTAANAVDYLSEVFCALAPRRLEPTHWFSQSELKIIARGLSFETLLNHAFESIIENAEGNVTVLTHLLNALQQIGAMTADPARRRVLSEQAASIAELAASSIQSTAARKKVQDHLAQVRKELSAV